MEDPPMENSDITNDVPKERWVKQYDSSTKRHFYYNPVRKESLWELPEGFDVSLIIEEPNVECEASIKIQSSYPGEEDQEEEQIPDDTAQNIDQNTEEEDSWSEHFDTRARQYYYHHRKSQITTYEKPQKFTKSNEAKETASVIAIQCAFRQHKASKTVEEKRKQLLDATDSRTIQLKLGDLRRAFDEIQNEIQLRGLTPKERDADPLLSRTIDSWEASCSSIKCQILDIYQLAAAIEHHTVRADKILDANRLHKRLAEIRSECINIHRTVLDTNSTFMTLAIARLNTACRVYAKWKDHEIARVADPRIMKAIHSGDLADIFGKVETSLRRATGSADFNTGSFSTLSIQPQQNDQFARWLEDVQSAKKSIDHMQHQLELKVQLLMNYRDAQAAKQELTLMQQEEQLCRKVEKAKQKEIQKAKEYAIFVEKCRKEWLKGLTMRQEDFREVVAQDTEILEQKMKEREKMEQMRFKDKKDRKKIKFSIWEAVKEGFPVDKIKEMVQAETQKAKQLGYDFHVRTTKSDVGDTLIQIASWWGHAHLISYFIEEGADLQAVDSLCNGYTLLHDAARRGHDKVIKILLQHGLKQDTLDMYGETPLHWATRRNNYAAVHTLLGAHRHDATDLEIVLKSIRTKNFKGKFPAQLTRSDCIKKLIQAYDEGRLPFMPKKKNVSLNSITSSSNGQISTIDASPTRSRMHSRHRPSQLLVSRQELKKLEMQEMGFLNTLDEQAVTPSPSSSSMRSKSIAVKNFHL